MADENRQLSQHAHAEIYGIGLVRDQGTTVVHSDGHTTINKTPKVTGKGQTFFVNKFLGHREITQ